MGFLISRPKESELSPSLKLAVKLSDEGWKSPLFLACVCPKCHHRIIHFKSRSSEKGLWVCSLREFSKVKDSHVWCRYCGHMKFFVSLYPNSDFDYLVRFLPSSSPLAPHFRPHVIHLYSLYDASLEWADAVFSLPSFNQHQLHIERFKLKRSTLGGFKTKDLQSKNPVDLALVVHKAEGARVPLTDSNGLYPSLLDTLWSRSDVVLLVLLDFPRSKLQQLIQDQPTLQLLM
eukprot:Platyproteum_vivax@DN10386_c0_g1_i1.p1